MDRLENLSKERHEQLQSLKNSRNDKTQFKFLNNLKSSLQKWIEKNDEK